MMLRRFEKHYLAWINAVLGLLVGASYGFKIVKMNVPDRIRAGNTMELKCEVDLGAQKLYSLTWWKDKHQFFKFSPRARNQVVSYSVEGIDVDLVNSTMELVIVKNVSLKTSGEYKCELVSESPSFEHESKSKNLTVVCDPDKPPFLKIERPSYSPGEILAATCVSPGAKPAPDLGWRINNIAVNRAYSTIQPSKLNNTSGLFTRTSRLKIPLRDYHFVDGEVHVSCSAFVPNFYQRPSHATVLQTGYRTVAPSQKYSGQGTVASSNSLALMASLWTSALLRLIMCSY